MIYVDIDVSKDKHDCYIVNSDGKVLADVFTVENNLEGFDLLFQGLKSVARDLDNVKVGLEATDHYSYNILGFLLGKGLATFVLNPLHTNLFRKSTSLRRTKTDRVDARTIAAMMMSGVVLKSYTAISYHNEELKSLSRYRFDKVCQRAKLKQSVSRLVTILFPELENLVSTRLYAPYSVGLCPACRITRRKAGRFLPSHAPHQPPLHRFQWSLWPFQSH